MSNDPFEMNNVITGEIVDPGTAMPSALSIPPGVSLQRTQTTYTTAMQVPVKRDLVEVERNLIRESTLLGERAYYGWGVGRDRVEGPSQGLAYTALRCWKNAVLEYAPMQDLGDSWIFTCYVIDLETGVTIPRPFRMSKTWKVHGKMDEARKEDIRFQIGASKAARNVILKFLPEWIIDKAVDAAKSGVRQKMAAFIEAKGLAAAQDLIIRELAKVGAREDVVLKRFGIADRKALDLDRLVILRGDLRALQDGEARVEELFPLDDGQVTPQSVVGSSGNASTRQISEIKSLVSASKEWTESLLLQKLGCPSLETLSAQQAKLAMEALKTSPRPQESLGASLSDDQQSELREVLQGINVPISKIEELYGDAIANIRDLNKKPSELLADMIAEAHNIAGSK